MIRRQMCGVGKKIIQLSVCPINGMLVTITHNVFGLGDGLEFEIRQPVTND